MEVQFRVYMCVFACTGSTSLSSDFVDYLHICTRIHIHTDTHTTHIYQHIERALAGYEGSTCQSTKQVYVRPATRRRPRPAVCTCERSPRVASRLFGVLFAKKKRVLLPVRAPFAVCVPICLCFFVCPRFRFLFFARRSKTRSSSYICVCVCGRICVSV